MYVGKITLNIGLILFTIYPFQMLIVNVAEKPSVAKSIANIFSNSVEVYKGQNKYCLNHKFIFKNNNMIFTSVLGHMYEFEFPSEYKN